MSGCPCDMLVHPKPPRIVPGLTSIFRQPATFNEFRRAMLAAIRSKPALAAWRPGPEDDLGLLLLEAWAYVADVLGFYDEVIAHEAYLRTARRRPSLRKLVELIGYLPRPAVAAAVQLALVAEGRKALTLPTGTAFRSDAFDSEPPQVFELDSDAVIHPLNGKWTLQPPRPTTLGETAPQALLLKLDSADVEEDDILLIRHTASDLATATRQATGVAEHTGEDGDTYVQVTFDATLPLAAATPLAQLQLLKPSQTASLSRRGNAALKPTGIVVVVLRRLGEPSPVSESSVAGDLITLDGLYRQIKPNDYIVMEQDDDRRWFRVLENLEAEIKVGGEETFTVNGNTVTSPPVYAPVTRLRLGADVDSRRPTGGSYWAADADTPSKTTVHYGMAKAGVVTVEAKTRIGNGDPLVLKPPVEEPLDASAPKRFLLHDLNEEGFDLSASISYKQRRLTPQAGTDLGDGLAVPVSAYGNVVTATRGETVQEEVLGSGDASVPSQSFTLKKSPLTYLAAPTEGNDSGVKSTLQVRVDGVLWKEVPTFYGQSGDAQVYIVRQDDEGETTITFGDGVRGARLTTGTNNVTASYRHGAGEASPPANAITQMAKPVKGVTSVLNPLAAYGGADAEDAEDLRSDAPKAALTLGRAVSVPDMQAVVSSVPGVQLAKAEWTWHEKRQRPVVQVWFIGDAGIEETAAKRLRSVTDPSTPIVVSAATAIPLHLAIDVQVDARYTEADVLSDVADVLVDEETGLLAPRNLGIGTHLFRSRIFEAVLSVEGAESVKSIQFRRKDPPGLFAVHAYRLQVNRFAVLLAQAGLRTASLQRSSVGTEFSVITTGVQEGPSLEPFVSFVLTAPAGHYFDVELGSLRLNGEEVSGG